MWNKDLTPSQRGGLLAAGAIGLALGVLGGLWRLDWNVPLPGTEPASFHGALMLGAFVTLIGLEHAAAYERRVAYLAPACSALGALATALGAPHLLSASLLLAGTALLAALAFGNWRRDPAPHAAIGMVGALSGVFGNALWLSELPANHAAGAWLAFLVLTIVGERLELSHLQRPSAAVLTLLSAATLLLVGGAAMMPWLWSVGTVAMGVALVGFSFWLLAYDVARRDLRHHGRSRFTAVCLVSGYIWLGVGGLALPFAAPGGPSYDAALHSVFVGFVLAAVMAHASAILPALLNIEVPYAPFFYGHLALLDATLVVRVGADLAERQDLRAWGAMGNALALALFLLATIVSIRRGGSAGEAGS